MIDAYEDPDWWLVQQRAWLWEVGAAAFFDLDYGWCNLLMGWDPEVGYCRSDGIVANYAQIWPGGQPPR